MARASKAKITATVGGKLIVQRSQLPRDLFEALLSHLTWENPEYKDRVFRGLSTKVYNKNTHSWNELPRYIYGITCVRDTYYEIAREFTPDFERMCNERDIEVEWDDKRVIHPARPIPHSIELWDPQIPAVESLMNDDYGHQGVLEAPCGSGKTVMLLYVR